MSAAASSPVFCFACAAAVAAAAASGGDAEATDEAPLLLAFFAAVKLNAIEKERAKERSSDNGETTDIVAVRRKIDKCGSIEGEEKRERTQQR